MSKCNCKVGKENKDPAGPLKARAECRAAHVVELVKWAGELA